MHHGRHVQLHHLLVDGIPVAVGERRVLPPAARRVRVQVAADEAQLVHAPLQLGDAVLGRHARHLRQLAHAHEVLRIELDRPMDQPVADARPLRCGGLVAELVRHAGGARGEDGKVGAALALQFQLRAFQALADLVVADAEVLVGGAARDIGEGGELAVAEDRQLFRRGRVVTVAVDDHRRVPFRKGSDPAGLTPYSNAVLYFPEPTSRSRKGSDPQGLTPSTPLNPTPRALSLPPVGAS